MIKSTYSIGVDMKKVIDFIKEHKEVFIGAGCTILVVGGVVVFLRVKRRKDII